MWNHSRAVSVTDFLPTYTSKTAQSETLFHAVRGRSTQHFIKTSWTETPTALHQQLVVSSTLSWWQWWQWAGVLGCWPLPCPWPMTPAGFVQIREEVAIRRSHIQWVLKMHLMACKFVRNVLCMRTTKASASGAKSPLGLDSLDAMTGAAPDRSR